MTYALQADALGKTYQRRDGALLRALHAVSFELPQGESLGLCGSNGAGKSTLLKILAGAVRQSTGRWRSAAPLRAVVELGVGFHPDLSGRENALQLAALDGLSGRAARVHAAAALEFAGVEHAADEPLRAWSSGMQVRLAFASAIAHPCRVLLLDEVFAVGDQQFQTRCVERVRALQHQGTSIILCSHSLYDLRQLCSQALWLENGSVQAQGDCAVTTARYAASLRAPLPVRADRSAAHGPHTAAPRIDAVEVVGSDTATETRSGDDLLVRVRWSSPNTATVHCGVALLDHACDIVAACGTHMSGLAPVTGTSGCFEVRLPRLALLSGSFRVAAWLFDRHGLQRHDELVAEQPLTVLATRGQVGRVTLEHHWTHAEPPRFTLLSNPALELAPRSVAGA